MRITMIKKQLADGSPCEKCAQTEDMLRRRGLWERIDEVVWAIEGQQDSPGAVLGRQHGVEVAPFFVLLDDDGSESVYTSPLKLIREHFPNAPKSGKPVPAAVKEIPDVVARLANAEPQEILRWSLTRFGERCGIAFSGAEDVVLIDMASRLNLPFRVFCLDTGRLHQETYNLLDEVRRHYGIPIEVILPDAIALQRFVRKNGMHSFYQDGHQECCDIRKVEPLRRTLVQFDAWISGQRRDQCPATRAELPIVVEDISFKGAGDCLIKINPLARWARNQVFDYIHENAVPTNALHKQGYASIGCQPCTRAIRADQHEREGRWWWEAESEKECGLHVSGDGI